MTTKKERPDTVKRNGIATVEMKFRACGEWNENDVLIAISKAMNKIRPLVCNEVIDRTDRYAIHFNGIQNISIKLDTEKGEIMKLYCSDCQRWIRPVEGVTILFYEGYWWCAKCCKIAYWSKGRVVIDFLSPGKLIPKTTIHNEEVDDGTVKRN